jgi:hypothetical protein
MKVELTMEQADLLLLELGALIQDSDLTNDQIDQILQIRKSIAKSVLEEEGGINYG